MRRTLYLLLGCAIVGCADAPTPTEPARSSSAPLSKIVRPKLVEIIPGNYIVQTRRNVDPESLAAEYGITPDIIFGSKLKMRNPRTKELAVAPTRRRLGSTSNGINPRLTGFSGYVPASALERLGRDPRVKRIEADRYGYPTSDGYTTLTSTGYWNLDRLDQPALPLDGAYNSQGGEGQYVSVYVLDSGIRLDHVQFQGRAYYGADLWDGSRPPAGEEDCSGHGTAMAGLIGGATLGVARAVNLVSVRVISCPAPELDAPYGRTNYAKVLAGLQWIRADKMAYLPTAGAVANVSLGFLVKNDPAQVDSMAMLEDATFDLLDVGVTVVTSAGNTGELACHQSPSRMSPLQGVLSVAAITKADERIWMSNFGDCVTLSAPGDTMLVAFPLHPAHYTTLPTMTSGAAAHVSGAAALYLALHPSSSPEQVETALLKYAHRDVLRSSLTPSTLLVSTRFIDSVAVTADPARLGGTFLGINEGVAVRCHGYHVSGTELDQVRCQWRSSDTTIAVVSPTGSVYGRAPGTVRIHGESGPARDSVTLTVLSPIRAEPLPIRTRRSVHFYNQMVGPGGTTTQVEWWLGDGTYGVGESWPHRYMSSGVYNVTMCVHGWAGVSCHSQQVTAYP